MKRFVAELALLAAAVAAPLAPAPWSAAALLAATALWVLLRPPRREVWIAGVALGLAAAVLFAGWLAGRGPRPGEPAWRARAERGYARLWKGLWGEAKGAAAALARLPQEPDPASRRAAFRRLARFETGAGGGRHGLLLLDPDGVAVAWAGEGLLHELKPEAVPRAGDLFVAGWSAATLLAVEPLNGARRPWRVVAGASFPTRELPFGRHEPLRWSLVRDRGEADPAALAVAIPGAPLLVVAPPNAGEAPAAPPPGWRLAPARFAWLAIGFALFALTVTRGIAIALPSPAGTASFAAGPTERRTGGLVLLAVGAGIAGGAAAGVPAMPLAALAAGLALAAAAVRQPPLAARAAALRRRQGRAPGRRRAVLGGAAATLALAAAAAGFEWLAAPLDPAGAILAPPAAMSLRLAFAAAAFGLLALAGRRPPGGRVEAGDGWAWLAVALLVAAAAAADLPPLALLLLAAGGAAAARWAVARDLRRSATALAALALIGALAAASALETAYRLRLDRYAASDLLSRYAPPSPAAVGALARELQAHFAGRDLARLIPRIPARLERQDLAFALWRDSPLARRSTLSALVVEPRDHTRSSFSFGMPLTDEGTVDEALQHWEGVRPPLWKGAMIGGSAQLTYRGVPWATARYWLLPLPGFEAADRRPLVEVEVGLLRGGPAATPVEQQTAPALYALYDGDGHSLLSPWEEAPPLDPALRRASPAPVAAVVETPAGPARAHARRAGPGWEAVYLPFETPLAALERTATIAVSSLLVLALATALALLLALPRAAFRDLLRRTVRSYSKRLLLVYAALILAPLLLLNAVLVRAMEDRLEAGQRAAGEAALNSAQKELGDRIVNLQPGFSIDTALNDRVLSSLSQVVHHEVNLYWRSLVSASSKGELFTAGLLPKRIPGEIYTRLALLGYDLSSRTNRIGGIDYLELYAPLRLPGVVTSEERLFLSIPLLAQQEEAAAELAHLRRRALLVTAALVALSVALGSRLARNFTRPLAQLVEGTRRIAAGAPSLDFQPTELELAALTAAVDEMARKIADGRERLVREKQVVERMVENITSGVVSVDRERRVLMHNRVAAELLGVATGQNLDDAVARRPRLAPVAAFLKGAGGELRQATVRMSAEGGEEGEREWTLVWAPVPGAGEPSALLVVEDATEILRGQRLLAWAAMARMIAHEIKNPLTPIRLSAEHMREVYENDPESFDRVFERCTTNILAQVDELRSIASEFSAYSAIPRIDPQPGDLRVAISDLVEGYRAAPPEGVTVDFVADGAVPARFDAKLLGRAVRNLLENALRASAGGGRVTVRVERDEREPRHARIAVLDEGPGVPPELLGRIFDPYFSTHDTGTGLGLPIARRIAEEHGGSIAARNRPEGGLEVAITLPAGAAA
jgi:signal transduction histidine kinase